MDVDILVVGGGILGFSSAYHLKSENPDKKIIVIDKNLGPAQGNTAKSEGAFRNVFASETNYLLADSTINCFQFFQDKPWLRPQAQPYWIPLALQRRSAQSSQGRHWSNEEARYRAQGY